MSQSRGLCDLVPEVLSIAIPELSDLGLIGCTSCAVDESQTFDLVKRPGVLVAGQMGRWTGTKFIGMRQSKWRDLGPLDEIRRREVGRSQLVVSRLGVWNERRRSRSRSVAASQCQGCSRSPIFEWGFSVFTPKQQHFEGLDLFDIC